MARAKRVNRVPPVSSSRRAGSAWEDEFFGTARIRAGNPTDSAVYSETLNEDIGLALAGNDEYLLPYRPTPTINPQRPRTLAAGYDSGSQTLRIQFRDGDYYTYYNIPPSVWWRFQRAQSPGRFINTTLNYHPYNRGLV
jgi:KTSC domain